MSGWRGQINGNDEYRLESLVKTGRQQFKGGVTQSTNTKPRSDISSSFPKGKEKPRVWDQGKGSKRKFPEKPIKPRDHEQLLFHSGVQKEKDGHESDSSSPQEDIF